MTLDHAIAMASQSQVVSPLPPPYDGWFQSIHIKRIPIIENCLIHPKCFYVCVYVCTVHASDYDSVIKLLPYLVMDILSDFPGVPGLFVAAAYSGTLR